MKTTKLEALGACVPALEFAASHDTYQEGWEKNKRVDWAFWLLCHASNVHYLMAIGLVVEFAERALHLRPERDSHESIEAARVYSREPSDENRKACRELSAKFLGICAADVCLRDDPRFDLEFTVDAMHTIVTRAAVILGEGEEERQMARILEVCPVCPISEEGP